ncbi:hypothetical protein PILCRDRAFT_3857 [Piloderma croceum F 1598]|uniref:Protein kinase domain-containing protein n=1 Tax=Piloderma croceum (strain F 1598) TaxID=765440 RepID=A0A0C3G9R8_PILCF|nr:hypothetical protein PILCRDRAFT_3857 [Piloderma croceum F 1598]
MSHGNLFRALLKNNVVVIIHEVIVSLNYLHKSNITHRDVKAANILERLWKCRDIRDLCQQMHSMCSVLGGILPATPSIGPSHTNPPIPGGDSPAVPATLSKGTDVHQRNAIPFAPSLLPRTSQGHVIHLISLRSPQGAETRTSSSLASLMISRDGAASLI